MKLSIFLIIFFKFLSFYSEAQIVLKGKVVNENKEPLINATIWQVSAKNGVVSDMKGNFALTLSKADTIQIRYVGYESKSLFINESSFKNIVLQAVEIGSFSIPEIRAKAIDMRSTASYMNILKQQLTRDDENNIVPVINRVPGVLMQSGAINTNRLTIRGVGNRSPFSTTKIRAYFDDIPLTSGDGETTIEDIDLSIIDKVKVYKGPTASNFGAGLGGMIHLKSRAKNKTNNELHTTLSLGSYGLRRNVLTFNYQKNKFDFGVNFNKTHSNGYRENNEYDRQAVTFNGKYFGENSQTTLLINLIDVEAFIPSSLNKEDYLNEPQKAAFSWGNVKGNEDYNKNLIGISYQFQLHKFKQFALENKSSLFINNRKNDERRPFNVLEEISKSKGFRSTFSLHKNKTVYKIKPLITLGIEYFNENYFWKTFETEAIGKGNLLSNNEEDRNYLNLFSQFYYEFNEQLNVAIGLNLNKTQYHYFDLENSDNSGSRKFDWLISPNIGMTYKLNEAVNLFGVANHGFSPPSLEETLFPEGNINPNINMEKGWNFEIGTRGELAKRLMYELSVYQMNIKDLLVAKRVDADQFVGLNAGKTKHQGLEFYVEFEVLKNDFIHLQTFATYNFSHYNFIEFIDEEKDYSGNELTGTPPHQFNAGIDWEFKNRIYGNLNYRYIDAFPIRDDNSIYSDAYQVCNLKIGYKQNIHKFEFDMAAGIQNLFNEKYANMILINAGSFGGNLPRYYYPELPRNYYGRLALNYKF